MISDLVQTLLHKRGITDASEIEKFLKPDFVRDMHDPFLLADMEQAVERVLSAIERKEKIVVYADFDCDGIPAAVVMHDFLKKVGHENFEVYIPHRHNEGHGFHKGAIDTLASRGASLIITVDVGITARESAAHARSLGIDVIITDHHEIHGALPEAVAIVNPKREGYPFKDLCGAAVAWKLVQATLARGRARGILSFVRVPLEWEKWLLDMVGIATVADMVPLIRENRALARYGITVLRKSPRVGIHALCRKLRMDQRTLSEDDIGFSIAPRVNAASRMDQSELAFRLLSTTDAKEAEAIASELEKLNAKRKGVVASLVKEAKKLAHERFPEGAIVVLGNPLWKPALLGLAANSIMDERGGAVCLWGRDGNGVIKGSCRSDGSVNIVEMFAAAHVDAALEESGGHACAGGFSVSNEQVHHLPELFARAIDTIGWVVPEAASYDAEMGLEQVTPALLETLLQLAPFGAANKKPLFKISSVHVESVRVFGKEGNHTEIMLAQTLGGFTSQRLRAFDFFRTPDEFTHPPRVGHAVNLLATIERDTWRNSIALRLTDILAA